MEKSRNIPANIQRDVKEKHFLECAWDGTRLIEQHHIIEYHLGGLHTVENLILLCPNCHTQVHRGEITDEELRERQINHIKGDRKSISAPFDIQEPIVKLGGSTFERTPILVEVGDIPMLSYKTARDGEILFSARMYNQDGELIFWMSDNRIVMPSGFKVIAEDKHVEISDNIDPKNYLTIWQDDKGILNVLANTYIGGIPLTITPNELTFGEKRKVQMKGVHTVGCGCAFSFANPPQMTRKSIATIRPLNMGPIWPIPKFTVIWAVDDTIAKQKMLIGATAEGQIVVEVLKENSQWQFITQHLSISPNCTFDLRVEIYLNRIEIFINNSLISPVGAHNHMIPVHKITCLDTDMKIISASDQV